MRLMSILLEAILEAGAVKEITPTFFGQVANPYINKQLKEDLRSLYKLKRSIDLGEDKQAEFDQKKKEIQIKAAEIAVKEIFSFLEIDVPNNVEYDAVESIVDTIKISSPDSVLTGFLKIQIPLTTRGSSSFYTVKIDFDNSLVSYEQEGNELYLWTPETAKRYRRGVSRRSMNVARKGRTGGYASGAQGSKIGKAEEDEEDIRVVRGGTKHRLNIGSRKSLSPKKAKENTQKAIESGFEWDEVLNKFTKEEKGAKPDNMDTVTNKIEGLLLNIINVCLQEQMINDDQSELNRKVELVGEPSGDVQEVLTFLGSESMPIIKVSTFVNTKNYKVDKYKTKIQVNGLDMM